MATDLSMGDILNTLRYENIPLIDDDAIPIDEISVVDDDQPDRSLPELRIRRAELLPDEDETASRRAVKGVFSFSESVIPESLAGAEQRLRGIRYGRRLKAPTEVELLQLILSQEYGDPVEITRIEEMATTRKSVKRIRFLSGEWFRQVWAFKADPVETARELAVYQIGTDIGIQTGRPVGVHPKPADKIYPYGLAIIGGFVEHAGIPYSQLLTELQLSPYSLNLVAKSVARMLADSQCKLEAAAGLFEEYGIELKLDTPSKELKTRLLPALNIAEAEASGLIEACERLYHRQTGKPVISHGDTHTANLVTRDIELATSATKFGLIDWGTVCRDYQYGDFNDFLLHHIRQATKVCPGYASAAALGEIQDAYLDQYIKWNEKHGISYEPPAHDRLIQSALWNIYEMYDPVRTDPRDIGEKARYHRQALEADLKELSSHGYREDAHQIGKELDSLLLKHTPQ
jgi:hypothetical protein